MELLAGLLKLHAPVYTVWAACEDVLVLEKFRSGTYAIDNLHEPDKAMTRCLDVGGAKLRLLGPPPAVFRFSRRWLHQRRPTHASHRCRAR